jgi:CzcA family heavy metal efflux pump
MSTTPPSSGVGAFAIRHAKAIVFITLALCLAGAYSALQMPSSIFPETDFPRIVILVDNGVMPADEMMATITRPIEESMKEIPGALTVRSSTSRGSAEVNVFFEWSADMVQAELYVLGRLAQIRSTLPPTATTTVWRLTFNAFPIIGVSLTSAKRDITELWEMARYEIKPRFLRIPGLARVDLVGGRRPEYQLLVDPIKLAACGLSLDRVTLALMQNNLIAPAGMHPENYTLYLTIVDGRARTQDDVANLNIAVINGRPITVKDFAQVTRAPEPVFNVVTAEGTPAVLLNLRAQPHGSSTLDIAAALQAEIAELRKDLPPDMKIAFFYDQSLLVKASVDTVWECIIIGLILSVVIIFLFLKQWRTTLVAVFVIPVTVLITLAAMKLVGLSFNLMTLGGIAAAIGLVIDDAIVVVEAIHTRLMSGMDRLEAIKQGIADIFRPLVASTLTPVVVFIPLAFLDGISGVFFRSLALTMVVSMLTSLLLAVTLTPGLAGWLLRGPKAGAAAHDAHSEEGGALMHLLIRLYEAAVRPALRFSFITVLACVGVLYAGWIVYDKLESEFLPVMDEGGFILDYHAPWGTDINEVDRQLLLAEEIIKAVPEVESYSRRTGARLALALADPHFGDFLVKLKPERKRHSSEVVTELRQKLLAALPRFELSFATVLGDLVADLTYAPKPIEVRVYSTDLDFLKRKGPEIEAKLKEVSGVVDTFDGLAYTGPTLNVRVRHLDAQRFGLTTSDIGAAVNTALLGQIASSVLEGDRVVNLRVRVDPAYVNLRETLLNLPLRSATVPQSMPPQAGGHQPAAATTAPLVKLSQVADIVEEAGQIQLRRDDLRADIAVSARLDGRDLGSAMKEIRAKLAEDKSLAPGVIEFAGLFQQQQDAFRNLLVVLVLAIVLVFTVLLIEFRSYREPIAIVSGSVLAMVGTVLALWLTGTALNIVSFLGAIIGVGIVAKNGILMLDQVDHLMETGLSPHEALIRSGRRRLRPVLMTSLAAALGMLPLTLGITAGADMLKPLAIAVIGALCISVILSLIATPAVYSLFLNRNKAASS